MIARGMARDKVYSRKILHTLRFKALFFTLNMFDSTAWTGFDVQIFAVARKAEKGHQKVDGLLRLANHRPNLD
jgi:hypothetical protein